MKNLTQKFNLFLSILSLICCGQITTAQPYQSIFGDSTTQFNVFVPLSGIKSAIDDFDPELDQGQTHKYFFIKGNDTIINGNTYQRARNFDEYAPYVYLREDTLTGKIYSYISRFNEEYLVCDLSLSVGDTFCFHNFIMRYNRDTLHGYMIADSIVYVDGKKEIYFGNIYVDNGDNWSLAYYSKDPNKFYFKEGIGSIFGPIDYWDKNYKGLNILLCVHQDETLVYIRNSESSYGCDYNVMFSGINEHSKHKLHVYPNPLIDHLTVKNDELNITNLQIIDIQGRIIMNIIPENESEIIVNMSVLNSGLYLVRATMQGNNIIEKLIKY